MFTGIIQGMGRIKELESRRKSGRITIETALDIGGMGVGDSIAVDGACLTITALEERRFTADLSEETLNITTLGLKKRGDKVNLEPPLRVQDSLGGHIVTGHIDGIGIVSKRVKRGDGEVFGISIPYNLMRFMVKKGSVAMDGISLTIAEVVEDGFEVFVIPYTLENTTLSLKEVGDKVNIETDIIGKYIDRIFSFRGEKDADGNKIDKEFLKRHGFL